jgi:hypothetical protein
MRAILGLAGLLVAVAIVGLLAKKQLATVAAPASAPATGAVAGAPVPSGPPRQQVEQVRQSVDALMQAAPRTVPGDNQ